MKNTYSWLQGSAVELHRTPIKSRSHTPQRVRQVAAVVLVMIEQPKLPAVVAATHQLAPAPGVAVIAPTVTGAIAVSLAIATGRLRCAASLAVKISSCTSLT